MALDAVVGEIRNKGQTEAAAINAEAKAEADKILADANAKAAAIKAAAEEEVKRVVAQIEPLHQGQANGFTSARAT